MALRASSLSFQERGWTRLPAAPTGLSTTARVCIATRASVAEVEKLSTKFGTDRVQIKNGNGGLPKIVLSTPEGSLAEIYLFGACVTSWKTSVTSDLLYVRPDAVFDGKKPISGGIPHCFPQFGPGSIQQHGFARNVSWSILDAEGSSIRLGLQDNDYTRSMWDFSFEASYNVVLESKILKTELSIKNIDTRAFSFTTALHTYFHASLGGVLINGLKGCNTLNKDLLDPKNPRPGKEERDVINFQGFVDCIYLNTPEEVLLSNGLGNKISIKNKGWTDLVLWNPHLSMEACYKEFVCVENAKVSEAILEPGCSWTAKQELTIL